MERERELRYKAIEGRIGDVTDMASGATERARATDVRGGSRQPKGDADDKEPDPAPEPVAEQEPDLAPGPVAAKEPDPAPLTGGPVSLSSASFDDLRSLGLSVTQTKRILDFRERLGGFDSVDDLDYVPGFRKSLLTDLKDRVTL